MVASIVQSSPSMKLLFLEGATQFPFVGLFTDPAHSDKNKKKLKKNFILPNFTYHIGQVGQAETLLERIPQLLEKHRINFSDLDGIIVGAGPGSFIGMRIFYSFSKALALAQDLPLVLWPSLHFLSLTPVEVPYVLALIDAKKQRFYASLFAVEVEKEEAGARWETSGPRHRQEWKSRYQIQTHQKLINYSPQMSYPLWDAPLKDLYTLQVDNLGSDAFSNLQLQWVILEADYPNLLQQVQEKLPNGLEQRARVSVLCEHEFATCFHTLGEYLSQRHTVSVYQDKEFLLKDPYIQSLCVPSLLYTRLSEAEQQSERTVAYSETPKWTS